MATDNDAEKIARGPVTHLRSPWSLFPLCGQRGIVIVSRNPDDVSCKRCIATWERHEAIDRPDHD